MRRWLANASEDLLERTRHNRPPLSLRRLTAEADSAGRRRISAHIDHWLERYPTTPSVMLTVGVTAGLVSEVFLIASGTYGSSLLESICLVLKCVLAGFVCTSYFLSSAQRNHQLRGFGDTPTATRAVSTYGISLLLGVWVNWGFLLLGVCTLMWGLDGYQFAMLTLRTGSNR
jgi:hypothetical protein